MDKRGEARRLWEESGGTKPLKEIAEELGVSPATIRTWKRRDQWGESAETKQEFQKAETQRETNRKRQASVNRALVEHIEDAEELSDIEKDFCLYFVSTYNATDAAWKTGSYTTRNAAKVCGHRMLHKPAVAAEIKRLKEMKRAAILADADDLVEMHMRIAFADITDFVAWTYDKSFGIYGKNLVAVNRSDRIDGQLVKEVSESAQGFKLKLYDKKASLDFLERFFLANPMDQHKQTYDKARLELESRKVKVQEDKLHGLSEDMEKIVEGLQGVMDVINAPVSDRGLPDE